MKKLVFSLLMMTSFVTLGQSESSNNPFEESFTNMFAPPVGYGEITSGDINQNVGMPTVPLDGGLTALLLAGGAAGYRQYKKKRA